MNFISADAADVFLLTTERSRPWLATHLLLERFDFLIAMCAPSSAELELALSYSYQLRRYEGHDFDRSEQKHEDDEAVLGSGGAAGPTVVVEHRPAPRGNPAWDNPVERLFNTPALGLKHEWVFNASDTDPYPSMPHGHLYKNKQRRDKPKLDPYRNRMRLSRSSWNLRWRSPA